jgi:hypothetical protein
MTNVKVVGHATRRRRVVTGAATSLQVMRCDSEDGRGGKGAHSESGSRAFSHYISSSPTTSLHQTSASLSHCPTKINGQPPAIPRLSL